MHTPRPPACAPPCSLCLPHFDSGHYVALVRLGHAWYRMDDSVVTQVGEADVFKANAFLLFYERVPPESSDSGTER